MNKVQQLIKRITRHLCPENKELRRQVLSLTETKENQHERLQRLQGEVESLRSAKKDKVRKIQSLSQSIQRLQQALQEEKPTLITEEKATQILEPSEYWHETSRGRRNVRSYIEVTNTSKWIKRAKDILGDDINQSTPTECIDIVFEYFVKDNDWHYIRDRNSQDVPEHFQDQDTSYEDMKGDCEDKGSLMHKLMIATLRHNNFQDHEWRLLFILGGVTTGGHAYQAWIQPEGAIPVESTYNQRHAFYTSWTYRSPLHTQQFYTEFWGAANQSHGFSLLNDRRLEDLAP